MEPLYQANEQHLCIEGLTEKLSVLHHLNRQVSAARVVWSNARIDRNRVMYLLPQSLWQTIRAVRKYVRAIFGYDSEQYAQIKNLGFTKPGKP